MSTTPEKPKIASNYHEQTDRTFVRAISGEYNLAHELKRLRSLPRVRKGREQPFHSGPQQYSRQYLEPKDGLGQTLHIHLEEYSPGGKSQKHGHVNEAVFYILDGEGAEEHDGIRYEWEAGDAAIVHNNCVHQHFNRNPNRPARALVMKTKPMYMFLNMLFQKTIERTPKDPTPGYEDWQPRNDPFFVDAHEFDHDHEHDHNHDHAHTHPSTSSGQAR
ncbi:MAG: cupin domain-containing protein [Candidatus Lustribacter sp.]|jgi:gentisate 1,2-dioxygenase